jgi:hypothetical protein
MRTTARTMPPLLPRPSRRPSESVRSTVLAVIVVLLLAASSATVQSVSGQCGSPIGGSLVWSFPSLPAVEFTLSTVSAYFQLRVTEAQKNGTLLQSHREQPTSGQPGQAPVGAGVWKGIYQNIYSQSTRRPRARRREVR